MVIIETHGFRSKKPKQFGRSSLKTRAIQLIFIENTPPLNAGFSNCSAGLLSRVLMIARSKKPKQFGRSSLKTRAIQLIFIENTQSALRKAIILRCAH